MTKGERYWRSLKSKNTSLQRWKIASTNINQFAKIANTQKFVSKNELKNFNHLFQKVVKLKAEHKKIFMQTLSLAVKNKIIKNMSELIKITENNCTKAVSARELHSFLEVKDKFTDWIKRMFEYGFEENLDYLGFSEISKKFYYATINILIRRNIKLFP